MTKKRTLFCTLLWLFASIHFNVYSQTSSTKNVTTKNRPVIGLVLSGGGARGAAHVGVLKVLEELHIPIDIITGTSMGSVVGGLYACGYSAGQIEKLVADTDWEDIFSDTPSRVNLTLRRKLDEQKFPIKYEAGWKNGGIVIPTGLLQGQKLNLLLKSLTVSAPEDFDKLPIRFRAVAADVETGEEVILNHGNLAEAMRASLSIPGIFAPAQWNDRLLMDGGFINNVPVKQAKALGAEVVIVVDLSGELPNRVRLTSPFSILNQTLGIQIQRNTAGQLAALNEQDILIRVDLKKYSSTDFKLSTEMIEQGVIAAQMKSSSLIRYALTAEEYKKTQITRHKPAATLPVINRISIDNQSNLDTEILETFIHIEPSQQLGMSTLNADLEKIYGLNIFKSVDYNLLQQDSATNLLIKTKEKDWGPHYIGFGINVDSNFKRSARVNATASYKVNPFSGSGSEWRTDVQYGYDKEIYSEFYQPLDKKMHYFVKPWVRYSETNEEDYYPVNDTLEHSVSSSQIGLYTGRLFDNWGSLSVGVNRRSGDDRTNIDNLSISDAAANSGAAELIFEYDQLDSIEFPKQGALTRLSYVANRKDLGASVDEDRIRFNTLWASSFGKNSFILWSSLGAVLDNDPGPETEYAVGGLFSLSGLTESQLRGRYAGVARMLYMYDVSDTQSILKIPIHLGVSLEAGNAWNSSNQIRFDSLLLAGSIFIGFETPIGSLYLAHGYAEGGQTESYLFLGRNFTFF